MTQKETISIKRTIAIKAIVTPTWKQDAENELSQAISTCDQQLGQLEQEGQQVVRQEDQGSQQGEEDVQEEPN